MIKKEIAIKPNGLMRNACPKSPFKIAATERVVPQDGQGKFVIFFKRQTSKKIF